MLYRFLYLDSEALDQYVSVIEGGLITSARSRSLAAGTGEGGLDLRLATARASRAHETEDERTVQDTPAARFARLLDAARKDPETLNWIEVVNPDVDLENVGVGAMVTWECDVYIPDQVRMLQRAGGAGETLEVIAALLPGAEALGLDMSDLPAAHTIDAMTNMMKKIEIDGFVVGDDAETEWKFAGSLKGDVDFEALEGRAIFVGKVNRVLPVGGWKPFVALPGANLLSRSQRRALERRPPAEGEDENYLRGPAVLLDVLAIYR